MGRPTDVAIIGGGIIGHLAAILLARDGRAVTLLERDAAPVPDDAEACCSSWVRRGVTQFRLPHLFQPRFREIVETELPELVAAMDAGGCVRFNPLAALPSAVSGGRRPGDERFDVLTGRRPVVEAIVARLVAATPGIEVRRGAAVTELLVDHEAPVPRVRGVRTPAGEVFADVVVDAAGRRSPVADLLVAAGCRRPIEQVDDVGYVYYARDFRNDDGSVPPLNAPVQQVYESFSVITVPADRGWWSVVLVAGSTDRAMRRASGVAAWDRVLAALPAARPWADADHASDVAVIRRIEDRRRQHLVDGTPAATGLFAIGDAWACTNPSVGRGMSIGAMHAVALRDHLRESAGDADVTSALRWAARTAATVERYWTDTHNFDEHRLHEIQAQIDGRPYETDDRGWHLAQALAGAASVDPTMLRHYLDVAAVLDRGVEVLSRPGVAERAIELAPQARTLPGPSRQDLVELLGTELAVA
jgi:2-polyprenyl-6-methoxyphenol hydroxylase-like FAD-dependent oxidoreductase